VSVLWDCPKHAYSQEIISQTATIRKEATGSLGARFDLGALPGSQKFKLQLELINESDSDFGLQKMQTTCNCVKAVLRESTIKANGIGHLDVELTTESSDKATQARLVYPVYLMYSAERGINVTIEYSISGLVSFRGSQSFLTKAPAASKQHSFEVPILVTEPVKLSDVSVLGGPQLIDLKTKCVEKNGRQIVECGISIPQGLETSIVEILTIEDRISKAKTSLPVIVEVVPQVSIAPNVVSFVSLENKNEFTGRAIVRLNESILVFDENRVEFVPRIEASCQSGTIKIVQQVRMGVGIYRIEFSFVPSTKRKDNEEIFPQAIAVKVETPLKSSSRDLGVRFAKK